MSEVFNIYRTMENGVGRLVVRIHCTYMSLFVHYSCGDLGLLVSPGMHSHLIWGARSSNCALVNVCVDADEFHC